MTYLDKRMRALVKKQNTVNMAAYKASAKRSLAHEAIQKTVARAILKGSYLSQEVWTLPANWLHDTQRNHFSIVVTADSKRIKSRWGKVVEYMKEYCYRVPLGNGISLTYREESGFDLQAENNENLSAFVRKHGLTIICPDVDEVVQTLEDRLVFVNSIRESFKKI
jgi:hypothetical protein